MSSASSNLFTKADSSDYITAKRQMAISSEYIQANTPSQFNPVKRNGKLYNQNYTFIPNTSGTNCLMHAKNFELLKNYTIGTKYINQQYHPSTDGELDTLFNNGTGFDNSIWLFDLVVQPDNKIIVGGNFQNYNGTPCNYIARLNSDGTIDPSFYSGSGFDTSPLSGIQLQSNGQIIVGGNFQNYNGNPCSNIARLNSDGTFDFSFNIGSGFNVNVNNILIQPFNGKIIVGGSFTDFSGISCNYIARLNTDGTFDLSFNSGGTGFDMPLNQCDFAMQSNNQLIVVGSFQNYNDVNGTHSCNSIARLNTDGTFDDNFNIGGSGFDVLATCVTILPSGQLLVSGEFNNYVDSYGSHSCNYIARLNVDGSFDTTFNIGTGFNAGAWSQLIQSDGKIIVGGDFTSYRGILCGQIVRLNVNGELDTTFTTNTGSGFDNSVNSLAQQSSGNIIIGGIFQHFNGIPVNYIARLFS